jgi:hypothetical protein
MQKRNATAAVIGAGDYIGAEIAKKFAAEERVASREFLPIRRSLLALSSLSINNNKE